MNAHTLRAEDVRNQARSGRLAGPTCGLAMGYLQANLVIVPADLAFDFLRFCQLNPKPCPILDVTEPGAWEPSRLARGADLRTDLPRYRVYLAAWCECRFRLLVSNRGFERRHGWLHRKHVSQWWQRS